MISRNPKTPSLQWIAGFFDGEGCVHLRRPPHVGLVMHIAQSGDRGKVVLDSIAKTYGGRVSLHNRAGRSRKGGFVKEGWQLTMSGQTAHYFVHALAPHLHVKHDEARRALALCRLWYGKRGDQSLVKMRQLMKQQFGRE